MQGVRAPKARDHSTQTSPWMMLRVLRKGQSQTPLILQSLSGQPEDVANCSVGHLTGVALSYHHHYSCLKENHSMLRVTIQLHFSNWQFYILVLQWPKTLLYWFIKFSLTVFCWNSVKKLIIFYKLQLQQYTHTCIILHVFWHGTRLG